LRVWTWAFSLAKETGATVVILMPVFSVNGLK